MGAGATRLLSEPVPIDAYGDMGFRIRGQRHAGSVLIFPDRIEPWARTGPEGLSFGEVAAFLDGPGRVEILLFGTGTRGARADGALRAAFEGAGIGLEAMGTGAACRTYNVLLAERRRVGAALIAVP